MEKYSSDDMFIPVMPRILDPSLKLNGKSLVKSMEITEGRFKESKEDVCNLPTNSHIIDMPKDNEKKGLVIASKYKYYALIFVSVLVFIILIYFIYKYFSKKKETKPEDVNTKPSEELKMPTEDKIKAEADAKKYISEYIDITSDTDSEDDVIKQENVPLVNNLEAIKEERPPSPIVNVSIENFDNLNIVKQEPMSNGWENASVSSKGTVIEYIEDDVLFENADSEREEVDDEEEKTTDDNDDTDSLQYFNKYK